MFQEIDKRIVRYLEADLRMDLAEGLHGTEGSKNESSNSEDREIDVNAKEVETVSILPAKLGLSIRLIVSKDHLQRKR